jgi:PAS domain S-box-containing protein
MTNPTLALPETSRVIQKAAPLRCQCTLVLALALLFALVWLAPPRHIFEGAANYAWLHMALETPSLLVAAMVFGVAWNAYASERPGNFMLLAIGLSVTGAIDFAHVLSFKGMPDFVTPSDPEKAINFWLMARLSFALTLMAVALRPWRPFRRPGTRHLLLAAALALVVLVLWAGLTRQHALPRTFIAGQGLTRFKIGAEYLIIAILTVPALIFLRRAGRAREYDAPSLFAAAAISIPSELCFTLYSDVTDIFNLLGHVYKILAFGMIYRAVFIGSVRAPFERVLAAQAEMRAASFYVRSLIEASVDPLFMINPEGKITDVNQAAADITGRRRELLVGADFGACFTEPERARASFQTMLSENLVRDQLLTVRDAAGGRTEVLFNATAYRNGLGQVEGIVAAARDFTQIRRAQQTLVRQHALLSKITETGAIGIVVCDLSGHVTFANAEADKLLAGPDGARAPLSGAAGAAITDFGGAPLAPRQFPVDKVKADGQPVRNLQMALPGADGRRRLLLVNAAPLRDGAGALEAVVATLDDVTHSEAAEHMLRESQARLKIAMTAAHMGAWTLDLARGALAYSDEFCELMGLPSGMSHPDLAALLAAIHPDDRERIGAMLRQADRMPAAGWADFRVVWPDATVHWLSARASVERDAAGVARKLTGLGMDITERKNSELALLRVNRALRSLSAVNERLIHEQDEDGLLTAVCRVIVEHGGYPMAWVGRALHDEQRSVRCLARYGDAGDYLERAAIVWSDDEHGRGVTGSAIRTGTTQINQNYALDAGGGPWREDALRRGFRASIAFPLRDAGGVHGALTIYAAEPDSFDADAVKLLQELADDLAFGIVTLRMVAERDRMAHEQHHHEARLRESLIESVQALATTLELRDPYTAGHQKRVAALAKAIGQEMGLPEPRLQGMHLAASIHDVGKIQIPSEILNKPGRLSGIEMELIRTHATAGHDILKDIRFPWPIARIVHEHHEHLDGSGYPKRLDGAQILLESSIVTVADVVEAMTSHRPYRPGLGLEAALEHIVQYRGSWYRPEVVDACLKLFHEGRYDLTV